MSVSVRLPICLSICPQFCPGCISKTINSSDRFQILFSYSTDIADVQCCSFDWKNQNCQNYRILKIYENLVHFRLSVHFCPGCFSKTFHRVFINLHIMNLQMLKLCSVLVLIEKLQIVTIIEFWKFIRTYM